MNELRSRGKTVKIEDLEKVQYSELLGYFANPKGLEKRLFPENQEFDEYFTNEDLDYIRGVFEGKFLNSRQETNITLDIFAECCYNNKQSSKKIELENEKEHYDMIAEVMSRKDIYNRIKKKEKEILKSHGETMRSIDDSDVLKMFEKYKKKKSMRPFKNHAKGTKVKMTMGIYNKFRLSHPILIQRRSKTKKSTSEKVSEKAIYGLQKQKEGEGKVMDYINEFNDGEGAMVVTPYATHNTLLFSHPNPRSDTPDPQSRIITNLFTNPNLKVLDDKLKNYYKEGDKGMNMYTAYVAPSERMGSHWLINPKLDSPREYISMMFVDARNYLAYYFGKDSHHRSKIEGHKHSQHKDKIYMNRKEEKYYELYKKRVYRFLEPVSIMK